LSSGALRHRRLEHPIGYFSGVVLAPLVRDSTGGPYRRTSSRRAPDSKHQVRRQYFPMTWGRRQTCSPAPGIAPSGLGRGAFYQNQSQSRGWTRRLRGSRVAGMLPLRGIGRAFAAEGDWMWSALAEDFDACSRAFDPNASVDARCIILFDRGAFLPINLSTASGRLVSTAVRAPAYSEPGLEEAANDAIRSRYRERVDCTLHHTRRHRTCEMERECSGNCELGGGR